MPYKPPAKPANLTPKEDVEQEHLFQWARMMRHKYPELERMFHIPNGGTRKKAEAAKFRRTGVKPGVPDIFLPAARGGGYHGLFIELKRKTGGRVSPEQREWIEVLRAGNYKAVVCRGSEEAEKAIVEYLEQKTEKKATNDN